MYNIFVLDDHPVFLNGISILLENFECKVIGSAINKVDFFKYFKTRKLLPDVAFLDIKIGSETEAGIELAEYILNNYKHIKVIVFSSEDKLYQIKRLIDIGVHGYISKSGDIYEYDNAIKMVMENKKYYFIHDKNDYNLMHRYFSSEQIEKYFPKLSELHIQLIKLCGTDLSYDEIAKKMNRSSNCIEQMRKKICEILEIHTRQEIVKYAMQNGII